MLIFAEMEIPSPIRKLINYVLLLTFISTNSTSVMLNLHTPNTPYIFLGYVLHTYIWCHCTAFVNRNRYNISFYPFSFCFPLPFVQTFVFLIFCERMLSMTSISPRQGKVPRLLLKLSDKLGFCSKFGSRVKCENVNLGNYPPRQGKVPRLLLKLLRKLFDMNP